MNQAFLQLILGLKDLKEKRLDRELRETQFKESQFQFKEMVKQFEHTHQDKDLGEAFNLLASATPEMATGIEKLIRTRFAKDNPDAVEALIQGASQSSFRRGLMSMPAAQRQAGEQEGAMLAMTGGRAGMGGVARSQLEQQLASGQQQPGMSSAFAQMAMLSMPPQMGGLPPQAPPATPFQTLSENYQRNLAGMMPTEQRDIAQFNATTSREAVNVDAQRVRDQYNMFMAQYGLKGSLSKGAEMLSASDVVSLMRGAGDLLNDMKDPRTSREDNMARQQLYNQIMILLRSRAGVAGTGTFDVPGGQGTQINPSLGDPNSWINSTFQRMSGVNSPYPFLPTMPPRP